MRKTIYIYICFALLMGSCRTAKESAGSEKIFEDGQIRFGAYLDNEMEYESLQAKLNVEISLAGKAFSSRATMKIVKGQMIHLSVHPVLGIEVFRVVLTPENFLLIDRMNKRYVSESIDELEKTLSLKLDFEMFQALFMNQMFYPLQEQPVAFGSFNSHPADEGIGYIPKTKSEYDCEFVLDAMGCLMQATVKDPLGRASMQWSYSDFVPVRKKMYPSSILVALSSQKEKVELLMKGSDFQLDKPVDTDNTVSARYQKVSLNQLIK